MKIALNTLENSEAEIGRVARVSTVMPEPERTAGTVLKTLEAFHPGAKLVWIGATLQGILGTFPSRILTVNF